MGRRSRPGAIAAALCAALSLVPDSAGAAQVTASATASVIKPLILQMKQNLDFGTITIGTGTWSGATARLTRAGVLTCTASRLICTGATMPAIYNVSGTNNRVVLITVPNVTLVNQSDSSQTLSMVADAPASVTLTNSGPPGTDFNIGGTITIDSTTVGGTYVGTFNVTVDYQ